MEIQSDNETQNYIHLRKIKFLERLSDYLIQNHEALINDKTFDHVNSICEFSKGYWRLLFAEGSREISKSLEELHDQITLNYLHNLEDTPDKIRTKIYTALSHRIIYSAPKSLQLSLSSFFLIPANLATGISAATNTSDLIWRYAGDKSIDYNYYTKRALLLGVYAKARTFYFADDSEDYIKTKEFIKESLDNVIKFGSIKKVIKENLAIKSSECKIFSQIILPKIEDIPIIRFFL